MTDTPEAASATNNLALVSMVTGLLGLFFFLAGCAVPMMSTFGLAFAGIAVVTGFLARRQPPWTAEASTQSTVGLVSGCTVLAIWGLTLLLTLTVVGVMLMAILVSVVTSH
jgi:hypothetical protein